MNGCLCCVGRSVTISCHVLIIISSNSTVCLPLPLCSRFLLVRMSKLHFILRNVTNNFGSWVVWQFCLTDNFLNLPSTKYISARVVGMMVIAKVEKTLTYFRSFDEERPTALWHASYLRSRFKRQFPFSSLIQCLTIDIIADSICFQKASRGSWMLRMHPKGPEWSPKAPLPVSSLTSGSEYTIFINGCNLKLFLYALKLTASFGS